MVAILSVLVTAHALAGAASAAGTSGVIGPLDRRTALPLPSTVASLKSVSACHDRGSPLFASVCGSSRALFGSRKSACARVSSSSSHYVATGIPRGGGIQLRQSNDDNSVAEDTNKSQKIRNAIVAVSVLSLAVWKKEFLVGALQSLKGDFDLKQFLIDKLDTLAGYGNTGLVVLSCKDGHRNTRPSKMATTCSAFLSR